MGAFSLVPVEQARPVRLDSLEPGMGFVLWWDNERGYREPAVEGSVRKVSQGYVSVRIRYPDQEALINFDAADGDVRSFRATKTEVTEWSRGTLVVPKEDTDMAKTEEGTPKAVTAAPKAKAETKAENDCWCGCGAKVKKRFKPGHDARFYSQLAKVKAGELRFKDLSADAQTELGNMAGLEAALASHKRPPVAKTKDEPAPAPAKAPVKAQAKAEEKAPAAKGKKK